MSSLMVNYKCVPYIYRNGQWYRYITKITSNRLIPSNALIDSNNIPIEDSNGDLILISSSTAGLTAAYTILDTREYIPYITSNLKDIPTNAVFYGVRQPVFQGIGEFVYQE